MCFSSTAEALEDISYNAPKILRSKVYKDLHTYVDILVKGSKNKIINKTFINTHVYLPHASTVLSALHI